MTTNRLEEMKRRLLDQQNNRQKSLISLPSNKPSTPDISSIQQPSKAPVSSIVDPPQNNPTEPNIPQPLIQEAQKEVKILQDKHKDGVQQAQPSEQPPLQPQPQQAVPEQPGNGQFSQKCDEPQKQPIDIEKKNTDKYEEHKQGQAEEKNIPELSQFPPDHDKPNKTLVTVQEKSSIQEAANLDLVDKQPNFSCSVDEEVKGVVLPVMPESKVEKKQRKIVLKELESVKQCVRNLKSAVKGLKLLEKRVIENPKLRDQLKIYLVQLTKFEEEHKL